MLKKHGDTTLSLDFWDCECEEDYIHRNSEIVCPYCGARREEQPNSRAEEVDKTFVSKILKSCLSTLVRISATGDKTIFSRHIPEKGIPYVTERIIDYFNNKNKKKGK